MICKPPIPISHVSLQVFVLGVFCEGENTRGNLMDGGLVGELVVVGLYLAVLVLVLVVELDWGILMVFVVMV